MAENSLDLIGLFDFEGRIVYASPSHFQVLGFHPDDVRHQNFLALVHPDDLARVKTTFDTLITSEVQRAEKIEVRLLTSNGDWLSVEAIITFVSDGRAAPRLLFSGRDITERKQAERELRQFSLELQNRNDELDAYAHTVAHELKAPLSHIIGITDALLQYQFAKEEQHKQLRQILQGGQKMERIIRELLLLASVRKLEVQVEPLDMNLLISEAQIRLSELIEHYQAKFIMPPTWPTALGYAPWVEEVWINYISNAVKYGGRPPVVELGGTRQQDGTVCFWVRDNGHGLTEEEQEKLFEPFVRLVDKRIDGYGLGLSIVRRIVEKLGGRVDILSHTAPTLGATFRFTLPGIGSEGLEGK